MKKWASGLAILRILIVMVPVVAAKFVLLPNGAFENCKVGTDITGHQQGGWYFNSVDVKDGGGNKYIVLDAARSSYVSHKINSRPATIRFYEDGAVVTA